MKPKELWPRKSEEGKEKRRIKKAAAAFSRSGRSIQTSIVITFTILTMAAMIVLTLAMNRLFSSRLQKSVYEVNDELLSQVASNLEDYLHNMRRISDALYYDVIKAKDLSAETISTEINLLYEANKDNIISIALYRNDGSLITAAPIGVEMSGVDVRQQSWFQAAMDQIENLHFSTPHVQHLFESTSYTYTWVLSLSQAVEINEGGTVSTGVLLVDMDYGAMKDILAAVNDSSSAQYIYLSDSDGSIIYHPLQAEITSEEITAESKILAAYSDGIHQETYEGVERTVIIDTVSYTGWKIVAVIPSYAMNLALSGTRAYMVLIVSVVLLIVVLLTRQAAVSLSRPLIRLDKAIGNIEPGTVLERKIYEGGSSEVINLGDTLRAYMNQIVQLMDDMVKEEQDKRKSELDALQAQINPHFLYNTLESIVWMIEGGKYEEAIFMITQLASFFRLSLAKGKTIISIEDELKHAEIYMNIQKSRYKNAFAFTIDVDDDIRKCCIVKLIIQPLLENAIYHGIRDMKDGGMITIKGRRSEGDIYLEISDNGYGLTEEEAAELLKENDRPATLKRGSGVGLVNVNKRLQLRFGMMYGLKIESRPDEGTTVIVHIPTLVYNEENRRKLEQEGASS